MKGRYRRIMEEGVRGLFEQVENLILLIFFMEDEIC